MKEHIDTLVGEKSKFKGDIRFKGGIHVDGHIEGSVKADGSEGQVVISEKGSVKGTIKAPHVVINGTVDGDIECGERLELQENSRVTGNIQYRSIEMKLGAQVTGQLHVGGADGANSKPIGEKSGS